MMKSIKYTTILLSALTLGSFDKARAQTWGPVLTGGGLRFVLSDGTGQGEMIHNRRPTSVINRDPQYYGIGLSTAWLTRMVVQTNGRFLFSKPGISSDTDAGAVQWEVAGDDAPLITAHGTMRLDPREPSSSMFIGQELYQNGITSGNGIAYQIGQGNTAKNTGKLRFVYSGSGSNNNRLTLGFHSNDDIVNVTAGGNVGIGTTSPAYKLDVVGRSRFQKGSDGSAGFWLNNDGNTDRAFIGMIDNDYLGFWGNVNGWGMAMNATNGNVGIGTITPTNKLHVNGIVKIQPDGANGADILISSTVSDNSGYIFTNNNKDLYLGANNSNGAAIKLGRDRKVGIVTDGLGIGTYTPEDKLHLVGNNAKMIIDNGTNATSEIGLVFKNGDYTGSMPKNAIISKGYNSWKRGDMHFVLDGAADNGPYDINTDTKMIIKAESGNVGIGTTTPTQKLDIVSTGTRTAAGSGIDMQGGQTPMVRTSLRLSNTTGNTSSEYSAGFGINTYGNDGSGKFKYPFLNIETYSPTMPIIMEVNDKATMQIFQNEVVIGSDLPFPASDGVVPWSGMNAALKVRGRIAAAGLTCKDLSQWADNVFDDDYSLKPLEEVAAFVEEHNHLPDVPSEKDVIEKGLDVPDMLRIQMQKIEELTLYTIEQQKQLKEQQAQINALQKQLAGKK